MVTVVVWATVSPSCRKERVRELWDLPCERLSQAAATPEPTFRQGAPPSGASSWAGSSLVPFDGDEPDDMDRESTC